MRRLGLVLDRARGGLSRAFGQIARAWLRRAEGAARRAAARALAADFEALGLNSLPGLPSLASGSGRGVRRPT